MSYQFNIRRWIFPITWILVTTLASFILARYIYPEVEIEKKFFGLRKIHHYSFNNQLFFWAISISLFILLLGIVLRLINPVRAFSVLLVNRVLVSPWFVLTLTLASGCFYVLGLTKPLFISEQFFFVEKEVTLLSSIRLLLENDERFLGTIIFLFTILFPLFKYVLLFLSLLIKEKTQISRLSRWMSAISKWSMLDVYIVALLLLNMKFDSRIVNMELKEGVIWFSLSIILIMVAMIIPRISRIP
jgi:paraquat-inducible protein A